MLSCVIFSSGSLIFILTLELWAAICVENKGKTQQVFSPAFGERSTEEEWVERLYGESQGVGSAALEFQAAAKQFSSLPVLCHTGITLGAGSCARYSAGTPGNALGLHFCVWAETWAFEVNTPRSAPWGQTEKRFIDLKVREPPTFFLSPLKRVQRQAKHSRGGIVMLSSLCPTTVLVLHLFWHLFVDELHWGPSDTWICVPFSFPGSTCAAGWISVSFPACIFSGLENFFLWCLQVCLILSLWSGVPSTALARTLAKHDLFCCLVVVFKRSLVLWLKPNKSNAIKWLMDPHIATHVFQEQINFVTHRKR